MDINYKAWVDANTRYLDASLKFTLAALPKRIHLELSSEDGEAYTDGTKVHIGVNGLNADNEEELMTIVLFRIGHEAQHCLSTTDRAWQYGIMTGYHVICEELSKKIEPKPRRFVKESDYDRFLTDIDTDHNIRISKNSLLRFSHFICNSLEDGRIERLRSKIRPGFANYVIFCRGRDWERTPVPEEMAKDADKARTHICLILNQLLDLATMGIYQKGFAAIAAKYPETHKIVQSLIPLITKAVYAPTCRSCMNSAIEVTRLLAHEIAEAAMLTDIEKLLQDLLKNVIMAMHYPGDSSTEQTAGSLPIGEAAPGDGKGEENNSQGGISYFDDSVINDPNKKSSQGKSDDPAELPQRGYGRTYRSLSGGSGLDGGARHLP